MTRRFAGADEPATAASFGAWTRTSALPLGAVLAGGQNRRFGAPKALAEVAGERIIDRVQRALRAVTPDLVLIANDPSTYAAVGLPLRPDLEPGLGALGGILTALHWAREEGRPGILAVACDMPFLSPPLLARLAGEAWRPEPLAPGDPAGALPYVPGEGLPDVVVPESGGPRGVEPLCAYYSIRCSAAIEAELARGDRHMIGFWDDVRVRRLPEAEVRRYGDPALLFMNVNTPEERGLAEHALVAFGNEATEAGAKKLPQQAQ